MSKVALGSLVEDKRRVVQVDLPYLIESRLLVQANSGGGKSWTLRRLLEGSFGKVQHLVLDPEGEFASLRERYDYVLAGKGGDTPAEPRSAKLLARRLLELGASAILDIYELKAHDRVRFVRYFLEALVDAPKKLWHPVLVVVDEAHVYAPQKGEAESLGAVIDLASRGRKRGFCAVLATQRLAKLHKDAAAEMNNKLIGRSSLDVDMKRASEELGFTTREDQQRLRTLKPGEFFAFGPAISDVVCGVMIGEVRTSHPKVGTRYLVTPPPPTEKVRKVLSELADLPAEAEKEVQDLTAAKQTIAGLRRELTLAQKKGGVDGAELRRRLQEATRGLQGKVDELVDDVTGLRGEVGKMKAVMGRVPGNLEEIAGRIRAAVDGATGGPTPRRVPAGRTEAPPRPTAIPPPPSPCREPPAALQEDEATMEGLKAGARRILAEIARRYPATWTRSQLATLTGFTASGGTYTTYLGELRRRGLIHIEGNEVRVSEAGLAAVDVVPAAPATHAEVMTMWQGSLKAGCYRLLEAVVEAGDGGISREELGELTGFTPSGGTFTTYLGILRRNGLVKWDGPMVRPLPILWPELVPA